MFKFKTGKKKYGDLINPISDKALSKHRDENELLKDIEKKIIWGFYDTKKGSMIDIYPYKEDLLPILKNYQDCAAKNIDMSVMIPSLINNFEDDKRCTLKINKRAVVDIINWLRYIWDKEVEESV